MYGRQWTALLFACEHGNPAIVSRLVQVPGLDINYQDEGGDTAAHLASMNGHTECVRILAETGRVDWNLTDETGQTPLHQALANRHTDIAEIIMQQPNIDYNVQTEDGVTLGHAAVRGDLMDPEDLHARCVESLAGEERFDCWNVPDSEGNTPVMIAVESERWAMIAILLECPRVDLDVVNADGDHLEEITIRTFNEDLLWTSRSVQQRMILRDSLDIRQAGSVSSLQSLSRDAVLLILSNNNSQERLVRPLVDRLEQNITRQAREKLLAPYSAIRL